MSRERRKFIAACACHDPAHRTRSSLVEEAKKKKKKRKREDDSEAESGA